MLSAAIRCGVALVLAAAGLLKLAAPRASQVLKEDLMRAIAGRMPRPPRPRTRRDPSRAGSTGSSASVIGYFAMSRQSVELWSVRSGQLDLLRAALEGERATDESARKSQAVRAGLKRRKDSGKPVGPLLTGYCVEHRPDGTSVRVIDPDEAPILELMCDVAEAGGTPGDAARQLNAAGFRSKRGGPFSARTVRDLIGNLAYSGEKGYPVMIEPERHQRVLASLRRMDPAAVARRRPRPPRDQRYFLRGLAFCRCGASLYAREPAAGRHYLCSNVRLSTGLCNAAAIPADLIEGHVIAHVEAYIGALWMRSRTPRGACARPWTNTTGIGRF